MFVYGTMQQEHLFSLELLMIDHHFLMVLFNFYLHVNIFSLFSLLEMCELIVCLILCSYVCQTAFLKLPPIAPPRESNEVRHTYKGTEGGI